MQMTAAETDAIVARHVAPVGKILIDGVFENSASGQTLPVYNPADGREIAQLQAGSTADVDAAVAAARRSFEAGTWRNLPAPRQAEILWKLSQLIEDRLEDLATLESIDCGMPIVRTRVHVRRGIEALRYYAGMCTKLHGQTSSLRGDGVDFHAFTSPEPVGVAALITPWNGPLLVVCNKVAPALAAGCSVVIKPPEQASLSALEFGRLALDAGVPPGVINIVTGLGREAGQALADHPDVNKISFTGSTAVGKALVTAAAGNLKRLCLELGGKSPIFVFDDADMAQTIPTLFRAMFANSGQVCVAGSRIYVQRRSLDRVASGLKAIAARTRLGAGLDPSTELGPLISKEHKARVLGYIESGKAEGAELIHGGGAPAGGGYFVEPTIFLNATANMKMIQEEIFGPVMNLMVFDTLDEVAAIGNNSVYGLGAGVFTTNLDVAHTAARRLHAGNVWVNCYGIMDYSMPFGGFKESGWGRENGFDGVNAFLEPKSVYIAIQQADAR